MLYAFEPWPISDLPIRGRAEKFPIRRIYCVGRNYAAHAIEMGHDPSREQPFFFQKNPDSVTTAADIPYPPATRDLHPEVEMVVALGSGGVDIPVAEALNHVLGYTVGFDMTRRDLQQEAKRLGRPWEVGKSFELSAPCAPIVPVVDIGHPTSGGIWLKVNGEERQRGDLAQLIWKVPEVIAQLSGLFRLAAGDLIMTGTPAGVGSVHRGDHLSGGIDGVGTLEIRLM
jgi:fumarylpyruvate hydrolase